MRTFLTATIAVAGLLAACVPSGPIYLGPPAVILEGSVVALETRAPLANAEVCVFGADTLCVAADAKGEYRAAFYEEVLLEGGAVTVRFRPAGFPTAIAQLDSLLPGRAAIRVDCAISQRVTVSREPTACLPIQD
jgi:hypothetical protein